MKLKLAVALLIIGQLLFAAHAIEHGSEPHEHNGVVCLMVLNDEPDHLVPAAQVKTLSIQTHQSARLPAWNQFFVLKKRASRPPSTGPPSN